MDKITNQYIAGFFDGEGCIGIYSRKDHKGGFYLIVQLAQNKSNNITILMNYLKTKFGGNLSEQVTLSSRIKYNWQIGSDNAVKFLKTIRKHLILKKYQAEIAINWQMNRPDVERYNNGKVKCYTEDQIKFNYGVVRLLKALKKHDINVVMEEQKDLVDILVKLEPLAVIKGD